MSAAVNALTVWDDGTGPALYAGGFFATAGGMTVNSIAKWDGAAWSPVGSGSSGVGGGVMALTVFDDGTGPALYVGGNFGTIGGVANNVAKWDGVAYSPVGSGLGTVQTLTVFDDGTGPALYAGGNSFLLGGGMYASHVAKWNGTSWSYLGSGVSGPVRALMAFDDGTGPALYVAGGFISAGGMPAGGIAKWDGTTWSPLVSGVVTTFVASLTVFDDGMGPALYAGGGFTLAGDMGARGIARWDGTTWSPLGSGIGNGASALTVFDDGAGPALYAAGNFATAGGVFARSIARWSCGSGISLTGTQPGPNGPAGGPLYLHHANLTPGHEYFSVFSPNLCPGGPGTGSPNLFGLCTSNVQSLVNQLLLPVGTPPFHFIAPSSYVSWGPFVLLPASVDAVSVEVTGGIIGATSAVTRITVQ
jgi:hypothetical protein